MKHFFTLFRFVLPIIGLKFVVLYNLKKKVLVNKRVHKSEENSILRNIYKILVTINHEIGTGKTCANMS